MGVETEIKFQLPKRNLGASSRLTVPGCKIGKRSESDLLSTYFFESLFRSKRERKVLARLSTHSKKIQDALGSLNDFIADRKMAAEAALQAPPQNRRALAFASGIIVGREDEQTRLLMKAAAKELRAFRQLSGLG
jgi:hypothetical protein